MADVALPGDLLAEELERALARLESLCAQSSASGDRDGLEGMAARLARELEERGLECRIERADDGRGAQLPLLVARAPLGGRRPLLFLGHVDTVLDAAPPRREARALFGTGAIDMKGGLAVLLGALDLVARRGAPPPTDLLVALVPDEEVGGAISNRATARFGAEARACFVLEPGALRGGGTETVVAGRRGLVQFRLDVHGRAAHAGLDFWQGRSAVAAAGAWIAGAAALSEQDGPVVNLARAVGGDRDLVAAPAEHAALFGTGRHLNVVPERAAVEGEYRFLAPADGVALRARLGALTREVERAHDVRAELAIEFELPPVDTTPARLAFAERAVACAARRGWRLEVERDRGGVSFPNFLPAELALPVLDGLGPGGGGMHTREEFVDLASFARRLVLLADLLESELRGDAEPVEAR